MDIMNRIDILLECGFSDLTDYNDLVEIIRIIKEESGIPLNDENAGILVTHIAAAFRRNRTGEVIEALDREVFDQVTSAPQFLKARHILERITQVIKNELADDEDEFLLLHLCSLLGDDQE